MNSTFVQLGNIKYPGSTFDFILKLYGIGQGNLFKSLSNKTKGELLDLAYEWIKSNPIYLDKKRNITTAPLEPIILSNTLAKIPITLFKDGCLYKEGQEPIAYIILDIENYDLCEVRYEKYHKEVDELKSKIKTRQHNETNSIFYTDELIRLLIRNYLLQYLKAIEVDTDTYIIEHQKQKLQEFLIVLNNLKKLCIDDGMDSPIIELNISELSNLSHTKRKLPAARYIIHKINIIKEILHNTSADEINKFYINKMSMMLSNINDLICLHQPDGFGVHAKYQELLADYRNIINWSNNL